MPKLTDLELTSELAFAPGTAGGVEGADVAAACFSVTDALGSWAHAWMSRRMEKARLKLSCLWIWLEPVADFIIGMKGGQVGTGARLDGQTEGRRCLSALTIDDGRMTPALGFRAELSNRTSIGWQ